METVEDNEETLPNAAGFGRIRILGWKNRRDKQRILAFISFSTTTPGVE
jgi:hypothetical protein